MKATLKKIAAWGGTLAIVGFLGIQLVPYGRNHTNPPVQNEPNWDSPETRALAELACFDCHSNETEWPWYSNIAPVSWLVQHDVEDGRHELNFSEWGTNGEGEEGEEMAEAIWDGEMPMKIFLITHPEARLSEAELDQLADGLLVTGGGEGGERDERDGEHEGDDDDDDDDDGDRSEDDDDD